MNRFVSKFSTAAALALAAVPFVALAGVAHAQGVHVSVGDLGHAGRAAAFVQRVDRAAGALCGVDIKELSRVQACRQAVRAEAFAVLSEAQRMQLSNAGAVVRVASR